MQNNKQLPPGWGKNTEKPKSWNTQNNKLPNDFSNSPKALDTKENSDAVLTKNHQGEISNFVPSSGKETKTPIIESDIKSEQVSACSDNLNITKSTSTNKNDELGHSNKSIVKPSDKAITLSEKTIDKKSSRKKKVILFIAIIIIVVLVFVCVLISLKRKNDNQNNSTDKTEESFSTEKVYTSIVSEEITEEETTDNSSEITTETPSTTELPETTEPNISLTEYIGFWRNSNDDELTINSADQSSVNFSLYFYRLTSIENVVAELSGNIASFSYISNGEPWTGDGITSGILEFNKSSITVTLTESDITYIPKGYTIVFDIMDSQSRDDYQTDEPTFEENTSSSEEPIIETDNKVYCSVCGTDCTNRNMTDGICDDCYTHIPNVYCPNCEYGFFTTGVGISGFECPKCNYKFNYPPDSHSQEFFEISGYYKEHETLSNGEHIDKNYDGELYLYSDGTAYISSSGLSVNLNWDVEVMWNASNPYEKFSFATDNEYLTIYLQNDIKWIFKKIY